MSKRTSQSSEHRKSATSPDNKVYKEGTSISQECGSQDLDADADRAQSERQIKKIKDEMHIITAHEVVLKDLSDITNNYNLICIPDCCILKNECKSQHSASMSHQKQFPILTLEEQLFKIPYDSGMWLEALDACRDITSTMKYPSVDILRNVFTIILTKHDRDKVESIVTSRAVVTFNLILNTHPPCSERTRRLYAMFLFESCEDYEEGIFEHILKDINLCLQDLEEHKNLTNVNKRILSKNIAALSIIAEILENDLAIWNVKNCCKTNFLIVENCNKILIANYLWPENSTNTVGNKLEFIIKLSIISTKYLSNHDRNIVIRLCNLSMKCFLLFEKDKTCYFRNIHQSNVLGNALLKQLLEEPIEIVIKFIDCIKPSEMQFTLAEKILMYVCDGNRNSLDNYSDYKTLEVVKKLISSRKWTVFMDGKEIANTDTKMHFNDYRIMCENFNEKFSHNLNHQPNIKKKNVTKTVLLKRPIKMSRLNFLTLFCQCLKYFARYHKMADFEDIYLKKMDLLDKQDKYLLSEERKKLQKYQIVNTCVRECLQNLKTFDTIQSELFSLRKNYVYLDESLKSHNL